MLLEVTILTLAIPAGLLLAHLAQDELTQGKPYFRAIIIASILGIIWFWLTNKLTISLTLAFLGIISTIALIKSNGR
jgi:hypothetical protein